MNLLIDAGNSRIKWAQAEQNNLLHSGDVIYAEGAVIETLKKQWSELDAPNMVLLASVVDNDLSDSLVELIFTLWSVQATIIDSQSEFLGLKNGYRDYQQLGVDRWLAMIAAINLYDGPLCIIDFGTAITVDVIDKQKQHLGGYIIPGLRTIGDSLEQATNNLTMTTPKELTTELGRSTQECLVQGYTTAISGFVKQAVRYATSITDKKLQVLITGGGAEQILPVLSAEYVYNKDLVLLGMTYLDSIK